MTHENYPYASPPGTRVWQPALLPAQSNSEPLIATAVELPGDPQFFAPRLVAIAAIVVTIASVFNATMVPVATHIRPGPGFAPGLAYLSLVLGSLAGQAAVLAVLVVWGNGPLGVRLVWHWGLAMFAFSAWTFGYLVAMITEYRGWSFPTNEFQVAIFGLPLVALASQAVPWLFKLYLGWRIEHEGETVRATSDHRLSIRDMFVATVLVAVTMSAARLGKPDNVEEGFYWAGWGIGGAAAAAISLVSLVPMVYLTLGVRRAWVGAVEVAVLASALAAVASVIWMLLNPGGPSDKEIILFVTSIAAGYTLTLAGTLWIARAYGYRLVMGRTDLQSVRNGSG